MLRLRPLLLGAGAFALWVVAKYWSLVVQVWRENVYSDTYYYYLQCQAASASPRPLELMTPEYPTPAAALLYLPWQLGAHDYDSYRWFFLVGVVGLDAVFVALLLARNLTGGVLVWTLLETIAARLALLRFDILPAVLTGMAVLLLLEARARAASLFAAAGAALKLWPALLLPLVFARRRDPRPTLGVLLVAGGVVGLACVYAGGVERLLSPLGYQRDRGLQIESIAATPGMVARLTTPGYEVILSKWKAYELVGPGVQAALSATGVALLLAAVAFVVLVWAWYRAGSNPDAAAYLALFAVTAFIVTSKALSPQYLLWLAAPASVLVGHTLDAVGSAPAARARAVVTFAWVTVLVVLTSAVYPVHYEELLNGAPDATWLLVLRNLALVGFALWCAAASVGAVATRQQPRPLVANATL